MAPLSAPSAPAEMAAPKETKCKHKYPNSMGVIGLSVGLTLIFVVFQESQNTSPMEMEQHGLGKLGDYGLAAYAAAQLPAFAAVPTITRRFGAKPALLFSCTCGSVFACLLLLVAQMWDGSTGEAARIAMMTASGVLGALSTMIWPAQSLILTQYSPEALLNKYSSFFSFCFFSSGFIGPIVSSVALRVAGDLGIACSMVGFAVAGMVVLLGLPAPEGVLGAPACPKEETDQRRENSEGAQEQPTKNVDQPRIWLDRRFLHLCSMDFAQGLCLNAFVSVAVPLLSQAWGPEGETHLEAVQRLQWPLMANGVGHLVAGLAYAPIADRWGRRLAVFIQATGGIVALVLVACQLCLGQGVGGSSRVPFVLPAAFFAGFTFVYCRIGNSALTSSLFRERAAVAFAGMVMVRFLGTTIGFLVLPHLPPLLAGVAPLSLLVVVSIAACAHAPLFAPPGLKAASNASDFDSAESA